MKFLLDKEDLTSINEWECLLYFTFRELGMDLCKYAI